VAKILVADDNSNVQKTVALALVDLGVEVVAVNNGDAAVRKLADVMPDLVLADIFMPVRNGYEVCEYIKKDSRFSHVPVVLLVGAFDPLDEREAQRVGADGILKKPFVPPDPLMSMVKTLLDRTMGDRLVTVAISKTAVSAQGKAGGGVAIVEKPPVTAPVAAAAPPEEPPVEEFLPPVDRVSFGEGEHPIAFGQLLDTPAPAKESAAAPSGAVEPVDDEQVLTGTRDASLGDPIFWRTEEPEAEASDEESNAGDEGEASAEAPMRSWKLGDESLTAPADSPESDSEFLQPVEPFELVRDEKDDEAGKSPTVAEPTSLIVQDAASQASLNVEAGKPEDLAANPIEWMATAPPPPAEEIPVAAADWTAPASESADDIEAAEAEDLKLEEEEPVAPEVSALVAAPISIPSAAVPTPPVVAPTPPPAPAETKIAAQTSDPHKTQPSLKPMTQSVEDTARSILKQDWADLAASLQQQPKAVEPILEKPRPAPTLGASVYVAPAEAASVHAIQPPAPVAPAPVASTPVASAPAIPAPIAPISAAPLEDSEPNPANLSASGTPDPALVEAVVQRVLDKMRPQVVDIITKEFLRPVVQALVHREIQKR
jgi:CheY-like chemotaxis protein